MPIPAFQVTTRPRFGSRSIRSQVLVTIDQLLAGGQETFSTAQVLARLNPDDDPQRTWAIGRTLSRMVYGVKGRAPELVRVRRGVFQRI